MIFEFLLPIIGWLVLFGICFLIYSKMFYKEDPQTTHPEGQTLYTVLAAFFWITLYTCLSSIWSIMYSLIDLKYPDVIGAATNYSGGLTNVGVVYDTFAFPLAMIVVSAISAALLAFFLNYKLQKNNHLRSERLYTFIRFLVYIGGAVMIFFGFVYVVYSYLYGNLPMAVLLKALVALVIVGTVALYFYLVENKYTGENILNKIFAGLLIVVTFLTLYSSFSIIGTPAQARMYRLDSITLQNLQNVKQEIDNQDQSFGNKLKSLNDLTNDYVKNSVRTTAMTYSTTDTEYTLCADFNSDIPETINIPNRDTTWDYHAGNSCFTFKHLPTYAPVNANPGIPKPIMVR